MGQDGRLLWVKSTDEGGAQSVVEEVLGWSGGSYLERLVLQLSTASLLVFLIILKTRESRDGRERESKMTQVHVNKVITFPTYTV